MIHRAATVVFIAALGSSAARSSAQQAHDGASLPRHPSPISVDRTTSSPQGTVAVTVDALALAEIVEGKPAGFVLEDVPVAPGVARALVLREVVRDPSLAVEVITTLPGGLSVATPLSDEQIAEASGTILAGAVEGAAGSRAILSLGPAGLFGMVDDGTTRYVISSGPAHAGHPPLAFDVAQVPGSLLPMASWICRAENVGDAAADPPDGTFADAGLLCRQLRAALDTDHEYLGLFAGNELAASNYALLLVAAASEIFTEGPNARLGLVYLRLWATAEDPWTQSSPSPQLTQVKNVWNATMTGVSRDVAHFLSGRQLGGGAAWTSTLCTEKTYSLSANLTGFFPYPLVDHNPQNWDVIVVTHEIAHSLGAIHTHEHGLASPDLCGFGECNSAAQGTIMSYCYLCPGGMSNMNLSFAPISSVDMVTYMTTVDLVGCSFLAPFASLVAVDDFVTTDASAPLAHDLLANDVPANCGSIALALADPMSLAGGTITADVATGIVTYTAPIGFIGQDSFAYAIEGDGTPAVGQVFVWVGPQPADLNGDGRVNGADVTLVLGHWNTNDPAGDASGDGWVDGMDISTVLSQWTD